MTATEESDVTFLGFALSDCLVQADPQTEKYLRRVIRTALELAVSIDSDRRWAASGS